jgi:hypothetical protein
MSIYKLDLSESDRAALDAERARRGFRSCADLVRAWIRETADAPTREDIEFGAAFALGHHGPKPRYRR